MCGCFFLEAGLRDDAEVMTEHQKHKQGQGQRDAHGQRLDGTVGFSFVADQIEHCRTETHDNDGKKGNDDDSHGENVMYDAFQCKG